MDRQQGLRAFRLVATLLLCIASQACSRPPQAPAAQVLYVTSGFEDRVYVLDASTGAVMDTLFLDPRPGEVDEPHGVAAHSATGHWYATVSHGAPTLWKFEVGTNRLVGRLRLPLQGAARIGLSPDGALALVPDYFRASLGEPTSMVLVSLDELKVETTVQPCVAPHHGEFAPDGQTAAVACALSDEVVLFAPMDPGLARSVRLAPGSRPMNVAWSEDGARVYATLMGAGVVVAIDPETAQVTEHVATGGAPAQIALQPGGPLLAVPHRKGGFVALIDTTDLTELRRIPVEGANPHGVVWQADGQRVFVTYEGDTGGKGGALALDLHGERIWQADLGSYMLGIAVAVTPPPRLPPA